MRALRTAPASCCIYCLATGVPRTEEHLIPHCLGGRLTLRDAVCEPCRRLTGRREQLALDHDFAVPRTLLALKRRRARGKGPTRFPTVAMAGGEGPASGLNAATFPRAFSLPAFEPAGLLAGAIRTHKAPRIDAIACRLDLGTPTHHNVAAATPPRDARAYAWAIAKWAYALAVAERGLEGFDAQAMRDLLLGRRDDVFDFVGTPAARTPASRERLHDHCVQDDGPWLTVKLALFASAGMLPYEVVIGRIIPP